MKISIKQLKDMIRENLVEHPLYHRPGRFAVYVYDEQSHKDELLDMYDDYDDMMIELADLAKERKEAHGEDMRTGREIWFPGERSSRRKISK